MTDRLIPIDTAKTSGSQFPTLVQDEIEAVVSDVAPDVITADLASREFGLADDGEGGVVFASDGVPTGGPSFEISAAWSAITGKPELGILDAESNVWTGQHEINGHEFSNSYDTDLWIAGTNRVDPTVESQGLWIQHRVTGDLGDKVHDAGASELRINDASNAGVGLNAFEASLVVTGGTVDVDGSTACSGVVANFHTSGTPTGSINRVALLEATQAPALAEGFSIGTLYGLKVDQQVVGDTNYTIYAPNGTSVLGPTKTGDLTVVTGGTGAVGSLLDQNGNKVVLLGSAASAVNYLQFNNAVTTGKPTISAAGSDANISLQLTPKGTGFVQIANGINLGSSDTPITRTSAAMIAVNGKPVGVKVSVPASADAAGVVGQWAADANYIYVAIGTDSWVRASAASW